MSRISGTRSRSPRAIRSVGLGVTEGEEFVEALMRIRAAGGTATSFGWAPWRFANRRSSAPRSRCLRTSPRANYVARFFLTRNGQVLDVYETEIDVRKVGLERFLYNLAHDQPLVYGLMSLAIAIAAGWGASAAFRLIRF